MKIKKDTQCIFFKFIDFGKLSYVDEHKKVLDEKGNVSFIKLGKAVNHKKAQDVLDSNGGIIFRGSYKKNEGKYYYAHLVSFQTFNKELNCPKYYDELYEPEKREADCFTVDSMIEIPEDKIDKFITVSNEKPLRVSSKARIPFIYVKAEKDIEL